MLFAKNWQKSGDAVPFLTVPLKSEGSFPRQGGLPGAVRILNDAASAGCRQRIVSFLAGCLVCPCLQLMVCYTFAIFFFLLIVVDSETIFKKYHIRGIHSRLWFIAK